VSGKTVRDACDEALWNGMDKAKFFMGGGAMFSGVTVGRSKLTASELVLKASMISVLDTII
jgi:hypothetical protein